MPRKKTLWFRFYVEAIHDRKLRRQPPSSRWLWVVVLALARKSPVPGTLLLTVEGGEDEPLEIEDLVDEAALPRKDVVTGMGEFERLGMLERDDDGAWVVAKWGERQFESDDVTRRTRKHRSREQDGERRRNVPTSSDGTPSSRTRATEAETEADQEEGRDAEPDPLALLASTIPSRHRADLDAFAGRRRLAAALDAAAAAGWPPGRAVSAVLAGSFDTAKSVGAVLVARAEALARQSPPETTPGVACPDCNGAGIRWADDGSTAWPCGHPNARSTA